LARKKSTFERLEFLEKYKKNEIKIFDSNETDLIILTNHDGFEYASKTIKPDGNHLQYIVETDVADIIDIKRCLKQIRKKFKIKKMLKDGGRSMSNEIRQLGMLGGERISYEPFPGYEFMPDKITYDMILGQDGIGIDESPIGRSIVTFSQKIKTDRTENLCLHVYSM
jgi:hypothetical protein